jgi:Domain of unknown function (DUF5919)
MTGVPTTLKHLLAREHLRQHSEFCREYDRVARTIDKTLVGKWPSKAQFYRWVNGDVKGLPHGAHCRVLERMLPGWTAEQLFAPCLTPEHLHTPPRVPARSPASTTAHSIGLHGGLSAVHMTRSEFTDHVPPHALFDGARDIRAAGLSLNLVCQQYPDRDLRRLIIDGASLQCLFCDPDGKATTVYEAEEAYGAGQIASLTALNIQGVQRLRDALPDDARGRLSLAVYDETPRFNIVIVDDQKCVAQPYLPRTRGVDSPTLVVERQPTGGGLFDVFTSVFDALAERSRPI